MARREKDKGGRPAYEPTEKDHKFVEAMAACGFPHDDIALVLGITAKTMRKHFRETLDTAHIKANAKVAAHLFSMATDPNFPSATFFWMKCRMKWQETSAHRFVDSEGEDRNMRVIVEYSDKPPQPIP